MSTIVLAHGLFGFGHLLPGFLEFLPSVHYFNGVADHLRKQNHTVLEPQVNPIGSIQGRGEQLADSNLDLALERQYTRLACERAGIKDVGGFKKKAGGKLPTQR